MFEDLKVLELASVLAGPAAGQFFAELGAQVVKVENIKTNGDVTRSWKSKGEDTDDRSAYFCAVNWGKRSILVDLETSAGKDIVMQLAQQSEVIIASYKPGDAIRLGVDYESICRYNPTVIYGQITGYGSKDPRVGYDAVIQGESGFMHMNGVPGGPSLKMPVALIDILAAHHLKEGILLAMLKKQKTGQGGKIEVSLMQAAIASLANQATNWLIGKVIPQKQGSAHPNIAPYGDMFATASGDEILLAVGTNRQFQALCELLEIPSAASDPRFGSNVDRIHNRVDLHAVLQGAIQHHKTDLLIHQLALLNIPGGAIQNVKQVFETEYAHEILLQAADFVGVRTYVGTPLPQMASHFLPPPHRGQHTIEILCETLGIPKKTVEKLIFDGIVA